MKLSADLAWMLSLNEKLVAGSGEDTITESRGRNLLVAKTRWLVLLAIGFYALFAGILFFSVITASSLPKGSC